MQSRPQKTNRRDTSKRRHDSRQPHHSPSRRGSPPRPDEDQASDTPVIVGRHPVLEALRSGRPIDRLWIQQGLLEGSLREIAALAHERRIFLKEVPKAFLDRLSEGLVHQGVGAQVAIKPALDFDEWSGILQSSTAPFVYILDGIQDPHNLGAILRTADATGASGVIIPERGASGLTAVVAKASAGAIEYVPVVRVTNLAQTIDKMKKLGVFVYAAHPTASTLYTSVDWSGPIGLVIGSEGLGIRPLVRERCDGLVRLPMLGQVTSINASNAAAAIGFEVIRQRAKTQY